MIHPYPPRPHPVFLSFFFFTRICCTVMINFSTLYISYIFPVVIQTVLAPCEFFLTRKNTKKSHYKDAQLLWIY